MSMGIEPKSSRPLTHETTEVAYRPVSSMAVLCFCLSVVSALSFAHPVLWLLPAATLVLALATSARLEKARQEYAGQLLAKVAVLLSLAFGIGAPTKYAVEWWIISGEAHRFADRYLDTVLANQVKTSFVSMLPPPQRVGLEDNVDQLIRRHAALYRNYLMDPVVQTFRGKVEQAQVTYVGQDMYVYQDGSYFIGLEYRITLDDENRVMRVRLQVRGSVADAHEWKGRQWSVVSAHAEPVNDSQAAAK